MTNDMRELFWQIVKCNNMTTYFATNHSPCEEILRTQNIFRQQDFQVPEPWNGNLNAHLLFIASNPTIDEQEYFPDSTSTWNPELTEDFFLHRFSGGRQSWISNNRYVLQRDGNHYSNKPVKYWCEIYRRAIEAYDNKEINPGIDYAITEVVHCKSRARIGVNESLAECSSSFIKKIVKLSEAKVIIWVGKEAKQTAISLFKTGEETFHGPSLKTQNRYFIFTPAPNSNRPRKLEKILTKPQLEQIRKELRHK